MPIEVSCPACGVRLKAPDSKAGKKARCGKCGGRVPIPGPAPFSSSPGEAQKLRAGPVPGSPDDDPVPLATLVEDFDTLPPASTPSRPGLGSPAKTPPIASPGPA